MKKRSLLFGFVAAAIAAFIFSGCESATGSNGAPGLNAPNVLPGPDVTATDLEASYTQFETVWLQDSVKTVYGKVPVDKKLVVVGKPIVKAKDAEGNDLFLEVEGTLDIFDGASLNAGGVNTGRLKLQGVITGEGKVALPYKLSLDNEEEEDENGEQTSESIFQNETDDPDDGIAYYNDTGITSDHKTVGSLILTAGETETDEIDQDTLTKIFAEFASLDDKPVLGGSFKISGDVTLEAGKDLIVSTGGTIEVPAEAKLTITNTASYGGAGIIKVTGGTLEDNTTAIEAEPYTFGALTGTLEVTGGAFKVNASTSEVATLRTVAGSADALLALGEDGKVTFSKTGETISIDGEVTYAKVGTGNLNLPIYEGQTLEIAKDAVLTLGDNLVLSATSGELAVYGTLIVGAGKHLTAYTLFDSAGSSGIITVVPSGAVVGIGTEAGKNLIGNTDVGGTTLYTWTNGAADDVVISFAAHTIAVPAGVTHNASASAVKDAFKKRWAYVEAGKNGEDGAPGEDGVSILWKGESASAPDDPATNWAYYNTADKKSYIYDGSAWQTLAKDGVAGEDGVSIVWKGELAAAPTAPVTNWAYYNTADKKSYIYDGSAWQTLAQDGTPGTPGAPGATVINGSTSAAALQTAIASAIAAGAEVYLGDVTFTDTSSATVDFKGATVKVTGTLTVSSNVTVKVGDKGTLKVEGKIDVDGSVEVADGGTIYIPDIATAITFSSGTVNLTKGAKVYYGEEAFIGPAIPGAENPYTYNWSGGDTDGVTLKDNNVTDVTAGHVIAVKDTGIASSATLTVAANAKLSIAEDVTFTVTGTLEVAGELDVSLGNVTVEATGKIEAAATGTIKAPALDEGGLPVDGNKISIESGGSVELTEGASFYYGGEGFIGSSGGSGTYAYNWGTGAKVTLKTGNVTEVTAGIIVSVAGLDGNGAPTTAIVSGATLVIASGAKLTIEATSGLAVNGTLTIEGTLDGKNNAILFIGSGAIVDGNAATIFYPASGTTAGSAEADTTYTWASDAGGSSTDGWKAGS
jgi:hypothetical protein